MDEGERVNKLLQMMALRGSAKVYGFLAMRGSNRVFELLTLKHFRSSSSGGEITPTETICGEAICGQAICGGIN